MQINLVHYVHSHTSDKAITGLNATTPWANADAKRMATNRISLLTVEYGMVFSADTCYISVILGI
jgi:hypothetical protein